MTKKILRIVTYSVLGLFVVIQFIPSEIPPVQMDNPNDIIKNGAVDAQIGDILKSSCYDCHSNETHYPWYSYVAPVSWLVIHDVEEGRDELNFSEWASFTKKRQSKKSNEIGEEVEEGNMPMPIYTLTHPGAKLSSENKQILINWFSELSPEGAKEKHEDHEDEEDDD